ncbi:hypothetical protein EWM64_g6946, partial [Hericium alpestre]
LIHTDLHGPLVVQSIGGYKYWISFIDDYSCFRTIYLLRTKDGAFAAFKAFKAYAENHFDSQIKGLRDDKGGEYMSNEFIAFTTGAGITCQHTVRNRPQQNGVAERVNRTMDEGVTTMLAESGLPKTFWGECLVAYVHVWNRVGTSAIENATPYQLWHGTKPDVSRLRVWGCAAYVHVQKDKRRSLDPHMEKCIFIGYPEGYKGWKFYNPQTRKSDLPIDVYTSFSFAFARFLA